MNEMTKEQRSYLQAELARLAAEITAIEIKRRPFDRSIGLLQEQRDVLLEDHGVDGEPVGDCDTCGTLLLPGDLGHSDAEGSIYWCEDHAPTWTDVLENYKEAEDIELVDQDPEDFTLGRQAAQARVDAGDGGKKHVWELY